DVVPSKCAAHRSVLESRARPGPERNARARSGGNLPRDPPRVWRPQSGSVQHGGARGIVSAPARSYWFSRGMLLAGSGSGIAAKYARMFARSASETTLGVYGGICPEGLRTYAVIAARAGGRGASRAPAAVPWPSVPWHS